MGYRSDVTLAFYTRKPDKGRAAFVKAWLSNKGVLNDSDGEYEFIEGRGVIIKFRDVKWYPSYSDVQLMMQAYEEFDDNVCLAPDPDSQKDIEVQYACEFVRIGEDDDDVETKRSDYNEYVLGLKREITVDL